MKTEHSIHPDFSHEMLFSHAREMQSGRLSAHYAAQMSDVEYISVTFSPSLAARPSDVSVSKQ